MGIEELTIENFKKLYYEECLTEAAIALRYNTYQVAINRFRTKHNLPLVGKTGRIQHQLPDLTNQQKDLLIGSLLGDGTMSAPSKTTARFYEGHSFTQRKYTDWKAGIMASYVSNRYEGVKNQKNGRQFFSWNFATKSTTKLRPYYDLFYSSGKRVFPINLSDLISPFALAVWYLDDGSLLKGYYPRITFGLDKISLDRALNALEKMGFKVTVSGKQCKTFLFPGQDEKFFEGIREHVPECMAYKLPRLRIRNRYKIKIFENAI